MSDRDSLLGSIDKLKTRAGHVQQELVELHNSARFDPRLPGVSQRVARIEGETRVLCQEVEQLRQRLDDTTTT